MNYKQYLFVFCCGVVCALPRATATARMLIPQLRLQRQEAHARFSIPRIFQIFPPHCFIVHFSFFFCIVCIVSFHIVCFGLSSCIFFDWVRAMGCYLFLPDHIVGKTRGRFCALSSRKLSVCAIFYSFPTMPDYSSPK